MQYVCSDEILRPENRTDVVTEFLAPVCSQTSQV